MQVNLPTNEKLETFVLCAAINSTHAALEITELCNDDDFFSVKNKIVFSSIKSLCNQGIFITLQALIFEISKQDKKNEIDNAYITGLAFEYWSGMAYDKYMQDLKKISLLRKIVYSSQEMMKKAALDEANPETILAEYQDAMLKAQGLASKSIVSAEEISKTFNRERSFKEDSQWRFDRHRMGKKTYEGISTGYDLLDDALGSFQNGCIYTIGARTSMGKTTFMLNLIGNILKNHRVGVFSLEMPASIIYAKLACIEAHIRYRDFYDGKISQKELNRLLLREDNLVKTHLYIDDEANLNTVRLEARAKRLKNNKKIDILFIDYLTRIKCCGKYFSKHLEIDEITKCIQALSKTLNIPIIVLAQLNRQAISQTKSRPSMIDFKESGSIEEDSDACLLLHRPEYYNRADKPGIMEVIIDKNRIMGTRKTIEFYCDSAQCESYVEMIEIEEHLKNVQEREEKKVEHLSFAARYLHED